MKDFPHLFTTQAVIVLIFLALIGCSVNGNPVAGSPVAAGDSVQVAKEQPTSIQKDTTVSQPTPQLTSVPKEEPLANGKSFLDISLPDWLDDALLWVLLVSCVVAVTIFWVESDKLYDRVSRHRHEIEKLKNINSELGSRMSELSSTIKGLESKIGNLEMRLAQKISAMPHQQPTLPVVPTPNNVFYAPAPLHGPNGVFFNCMSEVQDVHSMFKVQIHGNSGTYEIIDLQRVKSSDQASLVILFDTTHCSLENARFFTQSSGKIVKKDGIWVVDLNHKCSVVLS